jgi:ferric-dicitrate binding protein FerR (iron transport regulator)
MDELLVKYFQNNCSDEEKESLFAWIEQSDENKKHYKHMRQLWDVNTLLTDPGVDNNFTETAYQQVLQKISEKDQIIKPQPKFVVLKTLLKYAAVAIVCFGLSGLLWIYKSDKNSHKWQSIEVPVGQRVKLKLTDGSIVWLNSKSKFSYPQNFSQQNRTVSLNGEAYFEVAHNAELPFVVKTGRADIAVKGTKFNLYAYENEPNIETTLIEGKVDFLENKSNGLQRTMLPNQQLIYNSELRTIKTIGNVNTGVVTSWVSGAYFFRDVSIREIIVRLTHYYNVKFNVRDSSILDYTCVGKFRIDESLEDVLKVISTSKPFKYEITDDKVTIY